jgi:iron complex transport system permease protein
MVIQAVTRKRVALWTTGALLVMLLVAVTMPLIGPSHISYQRAFSGLSPDHEILFYARIPRVLVALLAGGGLAVAGVLFQALLRDALATPYTLGVASGASLGAVLAIIGGLHTVASMPGVWGAASIGGLLALSLVIGIANEGRRLSSFTLLLAGVTINSMCIAVIMFLQNLASFGQSFAIVRWLMGGIEATNYSTIGWMAAIVIPICAFLYLRARDWNLLMVGEDWAAARGVSTSRLLLIGYLAGSMLTGAITALTGPIAFIGLIVPHALRIRLGSDNRILIPCSFLLGAAFLAVCDTLARTMLAPGEVPVGVITALVGGPFFIWLLRSKRHSLWL